MKSIDLNLLSALDALLDTGSVTAAAARMHLSTPAMSHTLARIRDLLGDPVLVRAGRKLVPTPRALALAEPVRRLVREAQALVEPPTVQDLRRVQRQFVLRAPDGMAVVFGAALSAALQQAMPQCSLKFLPESHVDAQGLREGRIDLDIGSVGDQAPEIETLVLYEQPLLGAVRRDHPLLQGRITAKRFAAERHVAIVSRPQEHLPVDAALAQLGLTRFVAMTVSNSYAALVSSARSSLVASAPARIAQGMAPSLGLVLFELPLKLPATPVALAWHPRHNADPAHAWLRENTQRVLGDPMWKVPAVPPLPGAP